MHAHLLHLFQDFALLSAFDYQISFVSPDTGSESSYLLAHVWDRHKIRFRYDTTSWFTDSPIASAMSCPQMPTAGLLPHNAPRSVVTPQGLYRAEIARGGACTYLCVCRMHVRVCLNVGFDATAWTKRIHDALVSPRYILFSRSVDPHRVAS